MSKYILLGYANLDGIVADTATVSGVNVPMQDVLAFANSAVFVDGATPALFLDVDMNLQSVLGGTIQVLSRKPDIFVNPVVAAVNQLQRGKAYSVAINDFSFLESIPEPTKISSTSAAIVNGSRTSTSATFYAYTDTTLNASGGTINVTQFDVVPNAVALSVESQTRNAQMRAQMFINN